MGESFRESFFPKCSNRPISTEFHQGPALDLLDRLPAQPHLARNLLVRHHAARGLTTEQRERGAVRTALSAPERSRLAL